MEGSKDVAFVEYGDIGAGGGVIACTDNTELDETVDLEGHSLCSSTSQTCFGSVPSVWCNCMLQAAHNKTSAG